MIYRITVKQGANTIYSHDIVLEDGFSFSDQFKSAMDIFRKNFPAVSLLDDDVSMKIDKAP